MKISTDNGVIRNLYGDVEAVRLIHEAGFDGIDYTFYDMIPEQDVLEWPDEQRKRLADEVAACAASVGLSFPQSHAPYLYKLRGIDRDRGTEYYRTLRAWLLNERSIPKTAEALIVHRTTLTYRLEKLRELIPIDLDDPDFRLYLLLSYHLMDTRSDRETR